MNLKNEKIKMKVYFAFYIIFVILTFVGAGYNILSHGQKNAGYAVIPMLFGLVFAGLYQEAKKEINDNKR